MMPIASAASLVAALARREVSSVELVTELLHDVEQVNPMINAIVTVDEAAALAAARAADDATARGEPLGALHGLPMTVKDCFDTAGMRTTAGARELTDNIPATDAVAVARLRRAGAIIVGKTNAPTYCADFQTYNDVFGTTNNPWDLARSPGGSSGGSAAAVATRMVALELGSDMSGSLRNPASACGVYCLKPSYGVVPQTGYISGPGSASGSLDMNVVGPIALDAESLSLAMNVLAGPGAPDDIAWRLELPIARHTRLQDFRVAAHVDDPFCAVDDEVQRCLTAAISAVEEAGTAVTEERLPVDFTESDGLFYELIRGASAATLGDDEFADELVVAATDATSLRRSQNARGVTQLLRDWHLADRRRMRLARRWAEFFGRYDVLLCPASPVSAITHDHSADMFTREITINGHARPYRDQVAWCGLASLCFLPAALVPVGLTAAGLPVGVQVIGPYLEDRTVLEFARGLGEIVGEIEAPAVLSGKPCSKQGDDR